MKEKCKGRSDLEKDASSAGVEPIGGLFSTAEIKILICYIFSAINEEIPANLLTNVLHMEGIANGFEVSDAITSLIKSGHIALRDPKIDSYVITPAGRNVAQTLKSSLSYAVKDRAYMAAFKTLSRFKNARSTDIRIVHEYGRTYIVCSALDKEAPFMSVKLQVADETQASCIEDHFLNDPSAVYAGLIELLTK